MEYPVPDPLDVEQLLTDIGANQDPANRPLISNESKTITVGTDVDTIQEALDMVPRILRHYWEIDIPDGDYNENLFLSGVYCVGTITGKDRTGWLKITGNVGTPSNVTIDSATIKNCHGLNVELSGVKVTTDSPYMEDNVGLGIVTSNTVTIRLSEVGSGCTNGLVSYGSDVKLNGYDIGSGNVEKGAYAKRGGQIVVRDNGASGNATDAGFYCANGMIQVVNSTLTGDVDNFRTGQGLIIDGDNDAIYGFSDAPNGLSMSADIQMNGNDVRGVAILEGQSGGNFIPRADDGQELAIGWGRDNTISLQTEDSAGNSVDRLYIPSGADVVGLDMNNNARLKDPENATATSDPTTDAPQGVMLIDIGGTIYEIPYYTH